MTATRDRLAIAELTTTLTGDFDLPTVLDTVARDACRGFSAFSAALVLVDERPAAEDAGLHVVAESLREATDDDWGFLTSGPVRDSARGGAVTMIADLADAEDTRWPAYRRAAMQAGMHGMRAFPITLLGTSVGALAVHTEEPWGVRRPNDLGQTLANLAAIAISIAPHTDQRRTDTRETIEMVLQGAVHIASATGIITEVSGVNSADARLRLHRLARAHQVTVSTHARRIVAAFDSDPGGFAGSELLTPPAVLPPPPHIDRV